MAKLPEWRMKLSFRTPSYLTADEKEKWIEILNTAPQRSVILLTFKFQSGGNWYHRWEPLVEAYCGWRAGGAGSKLRGEEIVELDELVSIEIIKDGANDKLTSP
ncbi:hypothetical protein SEA_ATUIN_246 [Arthrobacter phage Atuin]|nr:hypothetical protein SEA_ATUIN_45 [Arthrobacter phage Atuin]